MEEKQWKLAVSPMCSCSRFVLIMFHDEEGYENAFEHLIKWDPPDTSKASPLLTEGAWTSRETKKPHEVELHR